MSQSLQIKISDCDQATLESRRKIIDSVEETTSKQTQWFECESAEDYRRMRREGTNRFPKPVLDANATTVIIASSHADHKISLRRILPRNNAPIKGVFLHFHAGGFVIGSAASHDTLLGNIATELSLVVVSVEYRLATEFVFPSMGEDCLDAALFALSDEGEKTLGGPLTFMGGESAGGYLTIWTAIRLRERGIDVRKHIKALAPTYGIFDLTYTSSVRAHKRRAVMGASDTFKYIDAAFPPSQFPFEERKKGIWSPLYDDLHDLPPAIFVVGTADPLLDDSVFMASKWSLAGNTAKLVIVPEAIHGFTLFPLGEITEEGNAEILSFLKQYI
ncbi:related to lipase/esterase [Phialocephala subalpina]|uniref:Related to lipase/esterase n=1 Tax=Phialocephala subalpina TaxID=576137 RepID=A0A1L7XVM0_9HELO|nr:related to lipase/esterase [Phialocephala subalpina]